MDVSLLEVAWRSERDSMVRAIYLTCGDLDQAAEVVDDAFLHVFTRMRKARIDNVRGYLWRAAFNGSRRARDRNRRKDTAIDLVGRQSPTATGDPQERRWWELAQSLSTLEPQMRAAIVLRFYRDFTVPQVADHLGIPLGTAKSLIHRGLVALRGDLSATARCDNP